jgi:Protein of unknown function (DUF3347)
MKRILLFLVVVFLAFGIWWIFFRKAPGKPQEQKQEAIKSGKHSEAFNASVLKAISSYMDMKNAFVKGDTGLVKENSKQFITTMDSVDLDDLKKDSSAIYLSAKQEASDIKANASAIAMESSISEMRQDFRMVSENLYPFLKIIGYEGPRLYWRSCPDAFGENMEGTWLSNSREVSNPYQNASGHSGVSDNANCGDTKDSL